MFPTPTKSVLNSLFPGYSFSKITVSDGGAKSDIWNQIKADITGLDYLKAETYETNIRGSVIIAGFGTGEINDMSATAEKIRAADKSVIYKPDLKNKQDYDSYFNIYKNIMKNSLNETFSLIFQKA